MKDDKIRHSHSTPSGRAISGGTIESEEMFSVMLEDQPSDNYRFSIASILSPKDNISNTKRSISDSSNNRNSFNMKTIRRLFQESVYSVAGSSSSVLNQTTTDTRPIEPQFLLVFGIRYGLISFLSLLIGILLILTTVCFVEAIEPLLITLSLSPLLLIIAYIFPLYGLAVRCSPKRLKFLVFYSTILITLFIILYVTCFALVISDITKRNSNLGSIYGWFMAGFDTAKRDSNLGSIYGWFMTGFVTVILTWILIVNRVLVYSKYLTKTRLYEKHIRNVPFRRKTISGV